MRVFTCNHCKFPAKATEADLCPGCKQPHHQKCLTMFKDVKAKKFLCLVCLKKPLNNDK
jgi:hypothetical protein